MKRILHKLLRRPGSMEPVSIISHNDLAQRIYDKLGMDYFSPTIGLWFDGGYFNFIQDIPYYTSCPLEDASSPDITHPVGLLRPEDGLHKPVKLYFSGYASFEEAVQAWQEGMSRLRYDRLYILWEFQDDRENYDWLMRMFVALPFPTMALTHLPHPELPHSCCIIHPRTGKRDLRLFDYRSFLRQPPESLLLSLEDMSAEQRDFLWQVREKQWQMQLRARNRNMDPTILTTNCLAGFIYHNLGLQFRSPIINLYMRSNDFATLVTHLRDYAHSRMEEVTDSGMSYPVGRLIPQDAGLPALTLYFQHYDSFEEARDKWFARYARINYDNLYILHEFQNIDRDISASLPAFQRYPGKAIALLHKPDDRISPSHVFTCGPKDGSEFPPGFLLEHDGVTGRRYMDEFDYVSFLNS